MATFISRDHTEQVKQLYRVIYIVQGRMLSLGEHLFTLLCLYRAYNYGIKMKAEDLNPLCICFRRISGGHIVLVEKPVALRHSSVHLQAYAYSGTGGE